jgi:hypothetical protein
VYGIRYQSEASLVPFNTDNRERNENSSLTRALLIFFPCKDRLNILGFLPFADVLPLYKHTNMQSLARKAQGKLLLRATYLRRTCSHRVSEPSMSGVRGYVLEDFNSPGKRNIHNKYDEAPWHNSVALAQQTTAILPRAIPFYVCANFGAFAEKSFEHATINSDMSVVA